MKFDLGHAVITRGALALLERHDVEPASLLLRHACGDWGNVDKEDAKANEDALKYGARIFSVYKGAGWKVWCITNAQGDNGKRPSTTLMLPSEY